jgi:2-dehydropantoate 2-reductase
MKIAIIGSGGVGGYFGAKLAQAGFNVTFLARGKHLDVMRSKGLKVKSILGDFYLERVNATENIEEIGTVDLIILGVKAWQIKEVREQLKAIVKENTIILPLQNGVSAVDELADVINKSHIVGGLCRIISKIEEPGVINHFGVTPTIVFGELDNAPSGRTEEIKAIFDKAGIKSSISKDIVADLWKKFISICVSGLLAVTNTNYGELLTMKETREMMVELLEEIHLLSKKLNINIEDDFVKKTVSFIETYPPESTSSLTRDVWEGKPSEIEYQNGTVVRLAQENNIEVPVNKFVYYCILPMEKKARKGES